jgi:hypothetical protein
MKWFLKRLSEPSSQSSVAGVISTGAAMAAGALPWQAGIPALAMAVLGFLTPEKGASNG